MTLSQESEFCWRAQSLSDLRSSIRAVLVLPDCNCLRVCRVTLLRGSLHVMAENKCLVTEENPVTLRCVPLLSRWPSGETTTLKDGVVLCTVLTLAEQHHSPLFDGDIFHTEVIRRVIPHLREPFWRGEVEESNKDKCPTNAKPSSSWVSSGTWTEIDKLNRGQGFTFLFSILQRLECLLACHCFSWNLAGCQGQRDVSDNKLLLL